MSTKQAAGTRVFNTDWRCPNNPNKEQQQFVSRMYTLSIIFTIQAYSITCICALLPRVRFAFGICALCVYVCRVFVCVWVGTCCGGGSVGRPCNILASLYTYYLLLNVCRVMAICKCVCLFLAFMRRRHFYKCKLCGKIVS